MVHKLDLFVTQRTDATKVADEIKIILALDVHPPAVDAIEQYMNQQTDTKQSRLRPCCGKYVNTDDPILMQRMKADTATLRIKDRVCEQMIQVHRHCGQHNQPGETPARGEKQPRRKARQKKVCCHMEGSSHHCKNRGRVIA